MSVRPYSPAAQRPLTILNVAVPVGGAGTAVVPARLTLKTPPPTVPGAAEAAALVTRYTQAWIDR